VFRVLLIFILLSCCGNVLATDPTRPLIAGGNKVDAKQKVGLHLQSIIATDEHLLVVISGKTLTIGDSIGEYTLVAIDDKDVTLKSLEKTVTLSLFKRVVSKNN
jgi:hypothetical protein